MTSWNCGKIRREWASGTPGGRGCSRGKGRSLRMEGGWTDDGRSLWTEPNARSPYIAYTVCGVGMRQVEADLAVPMGSGMHQRGSVMNGKQKGILAGSAAILAGLVALMAGMNRNGLDPEAPVVEGSPAPAFSAFDLNGVPRSLDDYRGKVVLLNLWATWCAPCKAEMPSMQRLHEQIQNEDFQILAVSIDRPPEDHDRANPLGGALAEFAESFGLTFTILHDPSGEISTIYQSVGLPASFVVDREGIIVRKISGPMDWDADQNIQLIRGLLGGESPSGQ